MTKPKIALIIPSLRHGGSERVMSELANLWGVNQDLDVYLILLTNNQKECYQIHENVKVIRPKRGYKKKGISKLFYKIWILSYIRSTCKYLKVDSVLSFGERYNTIVLIALFGVQLKTYVSDRNSPFLNIGFFNELLRKYFYKKANGIIAQTEIAKEVLGKKTGNTNIKVIPNPIRKIEDKADVDKGKIILNVGRNVEQKNQSELIEIFKRVNQAKNWKLKILGNGPLKEKLLQKREELGIKDQVEIIDFTNNVDRYYKESSIFAFSSIREGFPNVLLEAKAHGLACISYDCPTGPKNIIDNGKNGFLIPLQDTAKFEKKLKLLMESEKKRYQFSLDKQEIKQKYSLENVGQKFLNFIISN